MRHSLVFLLSLLLYSCSSFDEDIYIASPSSFLFKKDNAVTGISLHSSYHRKKIRNYISNVRFIQLFEKALSRNIDVRIKLLDTEIKDLNSGSNSYLSLPTLGVGVSSSISKKDNSISYFGSLSSGASVNSIITKLSESSKLDTISRIKDVKLSITYNSLFISFSNAIYKLEKEKLILELLGEIMKLQKEKSDILEFTLMRGKIKESDFLNIQEELVQTKEEIANKKHIIERILYKLRMESGLILADESYSFTIIDQSQLLSGFSFENIINKGSVKLMEYEMALSYTDARNANQLFIPEISISIGTDLLDLVKDITMSSFANSVSVTFPLDISNKSDMKEARIKNYQKSVYEYKKSIFEGILKLSEAYTAYNDSKNKHLNTLELMKTKENELDTSNLKYKLGKISYIDLIDDKIETLKVRISTYESDFSYKQKALDLVIEAGYEF